MKKIDISTWKRKETYKNFIGYTNPSFAMGTRLDVTKLVNFCKNKKKSFFTCFLYLVTRCANEIESFRLRIDGEDVVLYDTVSPSYIVMLNNEELATCLTDSCEDFVSFYGNVREDIERVKNNNSPEFNKVPVLDCLYISCVPWTDFTSVINPYDFNNQSRSSIPRITWGKYVEKTKGCFEMAIDVSAHHSLMDGKHIAEFYEKMQNMLDAWENLL